MKDKKSKNTNSLNSLTKLVFVSITLIMIVTITVIITPYFIGNSNANVCAESTLLSSGIAIIGIAIAVWAGLNIMNAIEKKEVEEIHNSLREARGNINELSTMADDMSKQLEKDKGNIENIIRDRNNVYIGTFKQELIQTNSDIMSRYFYRRFSNAKFDNVSDFSQLVIIEQHFEQVFTQYTEHLPEKVIIREKAREGILLVESLQKQRKNRRNAEPSSYEGEAEEIIDLYLAYMYYEFHFLIGYMLDGVEMFDAFKKAAEGFLKIGKEFGLDIPEYSEKETQYDYEVSDENRELIIYFANTIGEAYSKVGQDEDIVGKSNSYNIKIEKKYLEDYLNKAIFYINIAVTLNKKLPEKEVYYRNLGCAYERIDKLTKKFGEHSEEIIKNYKKSFEISVSDGQVQMKRVQNIYHVLLSYYERYIKAAFNCFKSEKCKEIFETYESVNDFVENIRAYEHKEKFNYITKEQSECYEAAKQYIKEYQLFSEIAITDHSRFSLQRNLGAFCWTWIILMLLAGCKKFKEYYQDDPKVYLKKIEEAIEILVLMGKNDNYFKELHKRFEILKRITNKVKN